MIDYLLIYHFVLVVLFYLGVIWAPLGVLVGTIIFLLKIFKRKSIISNAKLIAISLSGLGYFIFIILIFYLTLVVEARLGLL